MIFKKKLSKIIITMLLVVIVATSVVINLGNTYTIMAKVNEKSSQAVMSENSNFDYDNADKYVADCLIYGMVDGEGNMTNSTSQFSMSILHNYMYKNLAEALIEDESLVNQSVYWDTIGNVLNGEFVKIENWQQIYYEIVLLDYLVSYTETQEFKDNYAIKTSEFGCQIYSNILSDVADIYDEDIDNLIENVSLSDAVEYSKKYGFVNKLDKYAGMLKEIQNVSSTAMEYYENLSKALAVKETNDEIIDFLKKIKEYGSELVYNFNWQK